MVSDQIKMYFLINIPLCWERDKCFIKLCSINIHNISIVTYVAKLPNYYVAGSPHRVFLSGRT